MIEPMEEGGRAAPVVRGDVAGGETINGRGGERIAGIRGTPVSEVEPGRKAGEGWPRIVGAILLSLPASGLGHVYLGWPGRGIALFLATALMLPVSLAAMAVPLPFFGYAVAAATLLPLKVFTFYDLLSRGRRRAAGRGVGWGMGVILVMAPVAALVTGAGVPLRRFMTESFKIPAASMAPTLLVGDRIVTNNLVYAFRMPRRGEVIVFRYPVDPSKYFIKRVIGLPGDRVELRDKTLFLNGEAREEPHAVHGDPAVWPAGAGTRDNFGPMTVPRGTLFVMGDNRDFSSDSRAWGTVAVSAVRGRAVSRYWSRDGKDGAVRWRRVGRVIR